ncbi:MAG: CaiB/BaiF CoA transferase family protein [Gammaproteobacteria bacterium]
MEPLSPLSGVRIVELTAYGFVPSGAAILADWGADVVRIEHPRNPDPMRGLMTTTDPRDGAVVDTLFDQFNRGKRCLALDVGEADGLAILYRLIRGADVFITSLLKPAQEKLRIRYEDLRQIHPRLIFAHGHGYGANGPDADRPGFDSIAYWARGGVGHALTFQGSPPAAQRAAFGDVMGGLAMASGISAALVHQRATGQGCAVDVSLLALACWQMAPDILKCEIDHQDAQRAPPAAGDAGLFNYETRDGRYLNLPLLLPKYLVNVLQALGREDLLADPRVRDFKGGVAPSGLEHELRGQFRSMSAGEIRARFQGREIAWSIWQTPEEVLADPQVTANRFVVENPGAASRHLIPAPVQFNQQPPRIARPAPAQGEHSVEILRQCGLEPARIDALLASGVVAQGDPGGWDDFGRLKRTQGS